ncbi:MAG: arylsulfatase [Spirochaetaceae bacterium]|nr:MAG: arylsulfatase [Spirochaetaceae bacterium]
MDTRPNIIFVLLDDLGYSDLGCYGGEIRTPNIDRLASGGVKFESMYNSARCCPSRASLMTGLYPPQAGIADFVSREPHPTKGPAHLGRLRDDCVTIAEVLNPVGYSCYFSGKWHMHEATGPTDRGFDEFYGYTMDHSHDQYDAEYYQRLPAGRSKEIDPPADEFYATDVFTEYGLEFIRQAQTRKNPWLLYLSHSAPHFPLQAPKSDIDRYVEVYERGWDVLRQERFARMVKLGLVDPDTWRLSERSIVPVDDDAVANGFSGRPNPAWDSLDPDRRADLARRMATFAAMVERVDAGIGRIVEHLEKTGCLENTMIMITSDNGACYEWGPFGFDENSRKGVTHLHTGAELEKIGGRGTYHSYGSAWANMCNTPFRMYKHFTYEGGVCAPFIAHWPAGFPGREEIVRGATHTIDVLPSIRDAASAPYPDSRDGHPVPPEEGIDLLPAMRGKPLPARTLFFSHQQARAVLSGSWKAVWSKRTPEPPRWELYDLESDRCELVDLAEAQPDVVTRLAAEWEAYRVRVGLEEFEPWHVPDEEDISD